MTESNGKYFKWVTPVLVTVSIFMLGTLNLRIDKIEGKITSVDTKLFTHLTNHEIHVPRTAVVDKNVFEMYCRAEEKRNQALIECVKKLHLKGKE